MICLGSPGSESFVLISASGLKAKHEPWRRMDVRMQSGILGRFGKADP